MLYVTAMVNVAADRAAAVDVFDRFVDERRIGNRHQVIGLRAELRAAEADVFHHAVDVFERDPLAEPHRPLGQHDQAADEIVDQRLAAETDADRQRTAEDRERGERHVDRVERRRARRTSAGCRRPASGWRRWRLC